MDYFQAFVIFSVILGKTNVFGENETQLWIEEAVLNVAFSLRRHKFQTNDLRYRSGKSISLYLQFPDPPLRKTHLQVASRCEKSFTECLKYLSELLNQRALTRETNPFTFEKNMSFAGKEAKNKDCLRLAEEDDTTFQEPALSTFKEGCDNFGACLNENGLFKNGDIRAKEHYPFACALYSFCPDPCCDNRVLTKMEDCKITPCGDGGPCMVNPDANKDWDSMINNEWNVTCPCSDFGTRWDSQSGMCVDVNECLEDGKCKENENCVNLVGGYHCVCALGFTADSGLGYCKIDGNVERLFQQFHQRTLTKTQPDP